MAAAGPNLSARSRSRHLFKGAGALIDRELGHRPLLYAACAIDTTTPAGKALFQMLGVFAEFERSIIQERIHAGIARARLVRTKSGKPIGRAKIAPTKEAAIRAALERGNGIVKTARECQTGTSGAAYQGREGRPA
jgi:DNA invertase Pin-like site-specific DNA recombinase